MEDEARMRIGILTFHGSHNYGSVLQAYALSTWLKDAGHETEIINLRNAAQKRAYRVFQVKGKGIKRILHAAFAVKNYPAAKRRAKRFEEFITQVLPLSKQAYSNGSELRGSTDYDVYITGSDQVWNPACQDFESAYYLDFVPDGAKRIAYAPSLGRAEFSDEKTDLIRSLLKNIDVISCREEAGASLLRRLTDKPVSVVCDPVVLLGKKKWEAFAAPSGIKEPYILTYFLENNNGTKALLPELQRLTGYRVVSLNEDLRDIGKGYIQAYDASPERFVGLFRDAAFVLTNSFHGTAFSTIFQRPFFTVIGPVHSANNNDSRKTDYLRGLALEDRLVSDEHTTQKPLSIDYSEAEMRMEKMRNAAAQYLMNAVEGEQA